MCAQLLGLEVEKESKDNCLTYFPWLNPRAPSCCSSGQLKWKVSRAYAQVALA